MNFSLLVLCFSFISTFAWSQVDTTYEYIVHTSAIDNLTQKECASFTRKNIKRIDKLTLRLQKTNNRYLHLFMVEEDAVLHSLCTAPAVPHSLSIPSSTPIINKVEDALTLHSQDTSISRPHFKRPEVISQEAFSKNGSREARAEALMMDAWYSFNRFENLCGREGGKSLQRYNAELDTITVAALYLAQRPSAEIPCSCMDMLDVNLAREKLSKEMKRTELIRQYISERQQYLQRVLADVPGSKAMLLPMKKCGHYFNAQVKE